MITRVRSGSLEVSEKRKQAGYFIAPSEYIFVIHEVEINGEKVFLPKPKIEKTKKEEVDWFSKEGFPNHKFEIHNSDKPGVVIYTVSPLKLLPGYFRGQVYINADSGKILKIVKEPIIRKYNIISQRVDIDFKDFQGFQMPYQTRLQGIYMEKEKQKQVDLSIEMKTYEFNLDFRTKNEF